MRIIKSIEDLRKLASKPDGAECFISLSGGIAKSSKQIWHNGKEWEIFSAISGCYNHYNDNELKLLTNIFEAIEKKSLILY